MDRVLRDNPGAIEMRLYNIAAINDKTGNRVLLTGYPMPHKECCTMLSKMTSHKDTRKILIEQAKNTKQIKAALFADYIKRYK